MALCFSTMTELNEHIEASLLQHRWDDNSGGAAVQMLSLHEHFQIVPDIRPGHTEELHGASNRVRHSLSMDDLVNWSRARAWPAWQRPPIRHNLIT
jgi:hypothetical protein